MIFRLSQKLASKLKVKKLAELPLYENEYADWSAHLFTFGRVQYIILSNTKSVYSCLMIGKGITNEKRFITSAMKTIGEFMEKEGESHKFQQFIAPSSTTVTFAKALNRSVIGLMNDHIHGTRFLLQDKFDLNDIAIYLNKTPLSALIDANGRNYANPKEVFAILSSGSN